MRKLIPQFISCCLRERILELFRRFGKTINYRILLNPDWRRKTIEHCEAVLLNLCAMVIFELFYISPDNLSSNVCFSFFQQSLRSTDSREPSRLEQHFNLALILIICNCDFDNWMKLHLVWLSNLLSCVQNSHLMQTLKTINAVKKQFNKLNHTSCVYWENSLNKRLRLNVIQFKIAFEFAYDNVQRNLNELVAYSEQLKVIRKFLAQRALH